MSHRQAPVDLAVRCDASPAGMGGILLVRSTGRVLSWWADAISDLDVAKFKAVRGDPSWQNEWEALAVLVSLIAFGEELAGAKWELQTDNQTAMTAAMKYKSTKPLMNLVAGEIALRLERLRSDLAVAQHVPGVLNVEADALSRLTEGKEVPECVRGVPRRAAPDRTGAFWLAWPHQW